MYVTGLRVSLENLTWCPSAFGYTTILLSVQINQRSSARLAVLFHQVGQRLYLLGIRSRPMPIKPRVVRKNRRCVQCRLPITVISPSQVAQKTVFFFSIAGGILICLRSHRRGVPNNVQVPLYRPGRQGLSPRRLDRLQREFLHTAFHWSSHCNAPLR
jgi:hypothetical protein